MKNSSCYQRQRIPAHSSLVCNFFFAAHSLPVAFFFFSVSTMSTESSISSDSTNSIKSPVLSSLSGSDVSTMQIITHRLNGRNYLRWAQSVKIVICARGKLGFLIGEFPAPAKTVAAYNSWLTENSIVLTWLANSMDPAISRRYFWFNTAKEVWDAARKMYSDLGNTSQMFEIRTKLKDVKEGANSVTQYLTELQDLWLIL